MTGKRLRLILVRHGLTAWNRELRLQGHSDVDLDAEGARQAECVANRMVQLSTSLEAIYSSDLKRARMTAEAIAAPFGLSVLTSEALRETMLGDWEGLTAEEIVSRGQGELLELYRADSCTNRPPGAEQMEDVFARMMQAAEQIRSEHESGDVVIVGHGGSLRTLICGVLHAPVTAMKHFVLHNAGISIIEETVGPGGREARIALLNDTSHLLA